MKIIHIHTNADMRRKFALLFAVVALLLMGCASSSEEDAHGQAHGAEDGWSVTAWGRRYEIFAEAGPLVAGVTSTSLTHVTSMRDFSAVTEGAVAAVFVGPDGSESVFEQNEILRPGVFDIAMTPAAAGTFELKFRVETDGLLVTVPAGRVRVGTADDPGGLIDEGDDGDHGHDHDESVDGHADANSEHGHEHDDSDGHDGDSGHGHDHDAPGPGATTLVSFLKEQQWKTPFRTEWTIEGEIHQVVSGAGRTRSIAGSEAVLTASLDGAVAASRWPHPGKRVNASDVVFRLAPRAGENHSLIELEAEEAEHRADLEVAKEQLGRFEALLKIEGASKAEVEAARAQVTALNAQHEAAKQNIRVARGTGGGAHVNVVSPISGQIAEVFVTPGEVVDAGETLARVVRTDPFWVEVYLHPTKAALLGEAPHGLLLRGAGMREPVRFEHDPVKLVSRAPVVDEHTGRVTCIFEVRGLNAELPLGAAVEADVLLAKARTGIVIPASAIVDDAGIAVVYIQVDGEGFERREIRVVAREGDLLLVDDLEQNERLVTVGGAAIRRAGLVSTDIGHGHAH